MRNARRVVVATLCGVLFGLVCAGLASGVGGAEAIAGLGPEQAARCAGGTP